MSGDPERAVHLMILPEVVGLFALWALLVGGFLGYTTALTSYSRSLRLAATAFLTLEWAIPLGVSLDVRRRSDDPDPMWIHAAALPVVNVFGVIAYLEDRKRSRGE